MGKVPASQRLLADQMQNPDSCLSCGKELGERKYITSWGSGGPGGLGVGLELEGSGDGQRLLRKGKQLKAKTS